MYVAKACTLSRIGSEEEAENIRETKLKSKDSATRWANGISVIFKVYTVLKILEGKICVGIMHLNVSIL